MADNEIRNEISQLGKYNLIHHLTEEVKSANESTVAGIGDDAAATRSGDLLTVTANKLFVEHIHFDLSYFPLKHLGFKCVTIAVTDILAMNAMPHQVMLNLAVSNRFSIEAVEEFMTGVRACCHYYHLDIAGFDITSSATGLAVSVTAIGQVEADRLVPGGKDFSERPGRLYHAVGAVAVFPDQRPPAAYETGTEP